jgi:hypothetical protein
MRKIFNQDEKQTARMSYSCFLIMRKPHCHAQPGLAEGQADGPLVEGNVASQLTILQPFRLFHVVQS